MHEESSGNELTIQEMDDQIVELIGKMKGANGRLYTAILMRLSTLLELRLRGAPSDEYREYRAKLASVIHLITASMGEGPKAALDAVRTAIPGLKT